MVAEKKLEEKSPMCKYHDNHIYVFTYVFDLIFLTGKGVKKLCLQEGKLRYGRLALKCFIFFFLFIPNEEEKKKLHPSSFSFSLTLLLFCHFLTHSSNRSAMVQLCWLLLSSLRLTAELQ